MEASAKTFGCLTGPSCKRCVLGQFKNTSHVNISQKIMHTVLALVRKKEEEDNEKQRKLWTFRNNFHKYPQRRRLHIPNQIPPRPTYSCRPLLKKYYSPFSICASAKSYCIIMLFSADWTQIRVTFVFLLLFLIIFLLDLCISSKNYLVLFTMKTCYWYQLTILQCKLIVLHKEIEVKHQEQQTGVLGHFLSLSHSLFFLFFPLFLLAELSWCVQGVWYSHARNYSIWQLYPGYHYTSNTGYIADISRDAGMCSIISVKALCKLGWDPVKEPKTILWKLPDRSNL